MAVPLSKVKNRRHSLEQAVLISVHQNEGGIDGSTTRFWDYVQILDAAARLQGMGLVEREQGKLKLSEQGLTYVNSLTRKTIPKPRDSVRVEAQADDRLYLPTGVALAAIHESVRTVGNEREQPLRTPVEGAASRRPGDTE